MKRPRFSTEKAYHKDAKNGLHLKPVQLSRVPKRPPLEVIIQAQASANFWQKVRPKPELVVSGPDLAQNSSDARRDSPVAPHKPGGMSPASTRTIKPLAPWRESGASDDRTLTGLPIVTDGSSTHSADAPKEQVYQPSGSSGKPTPVPLCDVAHIDHRLELESSASEAQTGLSANQGPTGLSRSPSKDFYH